MVQVPKPLLKENDMSGLQSSPALGVASIWKMNSKENALSPSAF